MPSAQTVDKSKLTAAIESAGKLAEKAGLARTGAFVAAVAGVLVLLAALGAGLEHETTASRMAIDSTPSDALPVIDVVVATRKVPMIEEVLGKKQ